MGQRRDPAQASGVELALLPAMTTQLERISAGLCATLLTVSVCAGASPPLGAEGASEIDPHATTPACIRVRAEARRGAGGYEHWVYIDSDCDLAAACDVSTDVHPESMTVTVQPRSTGSVLTASDASSNEFTPYVTCQLGPPG